LKEQYEQAVLEGQEGKDSHNIDDLNVDPEKMKHIKNIFEKGAVEDLTSSTNKSSEHVVDPEKLKQLKNMFEQGDVGTGEKQERHEELILGGMRHRALQIPILSINVLNYSATTKEARNIFKQMEENRFEDQNLKNKHVSFKL